MNLIKKFVSGLGQQTAPFGFSPQDPEASYKAGLGYIGDVGANLLANNQGGVNPFANLGASLQQAKADGTQRNKEQYTAQRLMEEAAVKRQEREQAETERKRREDYINTLPADVRMKAMSIPGYLDNWIAANDPALQKPSEPKLYEVGNSLVDGSGNIVFQDQGGGNINWKQTVLDDGVYWIDPNNPNNRVKVGERPKGDTRSSATELKELWKSEDEIPVLDNTIDSLQSALALNEKTFTGYTAGIRGEVGSKAPGVAGFFGIDPEAAKATSEFNKIMSLEAIKAMAETLAGATTDQELERFVNILADPNSDPAIRERTISRMLSLAEKLRQIKVMRVNELGGNKGQPVASGSATSGPPAGVTAEEWNAMTDEERAAWQ